MGFGQGRFSGGGRCHLDPLEWVAGVCPAICLQWLADDNSDRGLDEPTSDPPPPSALPKVRQGGSEVFLRLRDLPGLDRGEDGGRVERGGGGRGRGGACRAATGGGSDSGDGGVGGGSGGGGPSPSGRVGRSCFSGDAGGPAGSARSGGRGRARGRDAGGATAAAGEATQTGQTTTERRGETRRESGRGAACHRIIIVHTIPAYRALMRIPS